MKKSCRIFTLFLCFSLYFNTLSANPSFLWSFETGAKVIATPLILNDTLYIGSLDGKFYAIDPLTGTEYWHYSTGNEIRTTAAYSGNKVFFESGNVLYALDTKGNQLWTDTLYDGTLINEHDMWDCFRSFPQINDGVVYVGSEEGWLFGVDIESGTRTFEKQTPQADATIETPPVFYEGNVYIGDWQGVMTAYNIATQELIWQYDTKDDHTYSSWVNAILSKPLISKDTLYFGGRSCNLYALDPLTGEKLWMYHSPTDQWLYGGPSLHNDTLYVGSSYQEKLFVFNSKSAELFHESDLYGLSYGNPAFARDYVIVGTGGTSSTNQGSLSLINRKTMELAERFNVEGWVETPLVHEDNIYFGSGNGTIYALNIDSLLNTKRPETYLKNTGSIDLGIVQNTGTITGSFYAYNKGEGADSLVANSTPAYITIMPQACLLPPDDSVEINVTIDVSGLSAGSRSTTISYRSLNSMLSKNVVQKFIYEVEDVTSSVEKFSKPEAKLEAPYPNPVSGILNLHYILELPNSIEIRILTILGDEVYSETYENKPAGEYNIQLGTDGFKNGIYFIVLKAGDFQDTLKVIIAN